jgi:hypothetical protein
VLFGAVVVVLFGTDVVVVLFGTDVVVLFGTDVVVVLLGTVVVLLGVVVLVVSFGAVVLVVPLAAGVVVVLVAEGATVVVELAGNDVVDGSLAIVPDMPDALEPPDELAVPMTEVVVVFEVSEVPLEPLAEVPGFPLVDCAVETFAAPGCTDAVRSEASATAVAVDGWWCVT